MIYNNITNKDYYDLNKDFFECKLHYDVLVNPVLCQNANCEYMYCKQCVEKCPKSPNNQPKCPNCQQGSGFTTTGTKNVQRMLDNLLLTCVKCKETHSYSEASKCSRKYCETCAIFYNEKRPHHCFKCWRCSKGFKTIDTLGQHVKECNPKPDQNLNQQFKNSISEMWTAINQLNRKVSFVFDSIWTLLENKKLTDGFESFKYDSSEDKMSKFKSAIGNKNDTVDHIRSESISELDLRVFYRNDVMEFFDNYNCKKIGELETDLKIESIGKSPCSIIGEYIRMKNKKGIKGEEENEGKLESWISRMVRLVSKAMPVSLEQEDTLKNYEIKPYGTGTLYILDGNIKKTAGNGYYNTMARLEKPMREGIFEFKVRIDYDINKCIMIGLADESNVNPGNCNNKFIGIYTQGTQGFGLNKHHKNWQTKDGDIIDIKIDFNKGSIEFYLQGSIIADGNTNKFGSSTLYLVCHMAYNDSVTILDMIEIN